MTVIVNTRLGLPIPDPGERSELTLYRMPATAPIIAHEGYAMKVTYKAIFPDLNLWEIGSSLCGVLLTKCTSINIAVHTNKEAINNPPEIPATTAFKICYPYDM